jgi:hypothetical protein
LHWVALKFQDHQVLTRQARLHLWYLLDQVVAQIQESKFPEVYQALNPLDMVVVQGKKDEVDIHFEAAADLRQLIVLQVQVLQVLENLQVLDLRAHVQEV